MPSSLPSWLIERRLTQATPRSTNGAAPAPPEQVPPAPPPARTGRRRRVVLILLAVISLLAVLLVAEMRTSWLEARVLAHLAGELTYTVAEGPSPDARYPAHGPYDERLGYTQLPTFLDTLQQQSFAVAAQARVSTRFEGIVDRGLFPIYREKNQAGLRIVDWRDSVLSAVHYPHRVYARFEDVPPLVWQALLFIENRALLDARYPYRNPAVEWDRFTRALAEQGLEAMGFDVDAPGASTLATQLEKFRHSLGGRTDSPREKLRQMASASLRSYLDGDSTMAARHIIIRDYLNTVPLAAVRGYGEVIGLADGLWAWYDADFDEVNRLLWEAPRLGEDDDHGPHGAALRQVLSLYLANRRPSYYLLQPEDQAALERITDRYLDLLAGAGLLTPALHAAARTAHPPLRTYAPPPAAFSFLDRKAVNAVRAELLGRLGIPQLYELDHYDLTVQTTYDGDVQRAVTTLLHQLRDPAYVRAHQLVGGRLLGSADPADVTYAVVLYEATPTSNVVRVQADNFDGPFNINSGAKLELGSTAKLRTLVNYLQIVEALHARYAALSTAELRAVDVPRGDRLTAWAIGYLSRASDRSLPAMLEAAMERRYSASPAETFFTGGGAHVFHNFGGAYSGSVLSVREGFRHSVNLVFIRLMRDVVRYYLYALPGNPAAMLDDPDDPRRQEYLARFADQEGRLYLSRFYQRYIGKTEEGRWTTFVQSHRLTPRRLAWAFRSADPLADLDAFAAFIAAHAPGAVRPDDAEAALYARTDPSTFSWQDRGYLAGVHPLELWLLGYLRLHPLASWPEVAEAGTDVRQEVYAWLFRPSNRRGQDRRIRTLLEEEAFTEVHRAWRQVGYPFDRLVPSYATAIGSSADRPNALAELVGIILRDGARYPTSRIESLHFAEGTPYEALMRYQAPAPVRVLSPDVAATLRAAMTDVVERGTGRRAYRAVADTAGTPVVIGGKTGTGDNRTRIYTAGGRLLDSRPLNRTSTFVFFIGDNLFGTITAYVAGAEADRFAFTSSLPTQLLKMLGPALTPLVGLAPPSAVSTSPPPFVPAVRRTRRAAPPPLAPLPGLPPLRPRPLLDAPRPDTTGL